MARLILFADHSPAVQRRAERILLDQGFAVETVSNGVAAIKKFSRLQPDLVFADVSMAGKDGYEVCDFLKTSADFHGVPVLLVASDLEPYDQGRGERVGADGMLKKPFTDHELINVVSKFSSPEAAPETLDIPEPGTDAEPQPEPASAAPPPVAVLEAQAIPVPAGLEPISKAWVEQQPEPVASSPEPVAESAAPVELPSSAHGPMHQSVAEAAPELMLVSSELIQGITEPVGPQRGKQEAQPDLPSPPEPLAEAVPPPVETSLTAAPPALPEEAPLETQTNPPDNNAALPAHPEWVHLVVRKVVTRMVPSVLPAPIVEEIVRKLTDEINAELAVPQGSSS